MTAEQKWDAESPAIGKALHPVVLVTGGSRGIGKAIAMEFAQQGHNIFLVARNADALAVTARELEQARNVQVFTLATDLSADGACDTIRDAVDAADCYVDVLVNNAALGAVGAFASTDATELNDLLNLNMLVPSALIRMFLPDMIQRERGGVLSIGSVAGHSPAPYVAAYGSSKAFLVSLTHALAAEVEPSGVSMSVLSPGPVHTRLLDGMFTSGGKLSWLYPKLSPNVVARIGFDGFSTGRRVIVPGLFNWLVVYGSKLLPDKPLARCLAFMMRANRPHLR